MNLKNIYIWLISLILVGLASCNFLELEPTSEFERNAYYEDDTQTLMALSAIYSKLGDSYKEHLSIWLNAGTDEALHSKQASSTRGSEISKYLYDEYNTDINKIWTQAYDLISRANDFIYNLQGRDSIIDLSISERQGMIGEAMTLRAFTYLNLVRMFEYVPVRTEPFVDLAEDNGELHLGSLEPAEVYDQIISDLNSAIGLLPDEPAMDNRIYKNVANGILARTYLHLAGVRVNGGDIGVETCFEKVIENCDAVINSGNHGLYSDYSEPFMNECQQVYDNYEILWEVNFLYTDERDLGGYIGNYNGPNVAGEVNTDPTGNPYLYATATLNQLYGSEYEETPELNTDTRHAWNIVPYNIKYSSGVYSFPGNIGNKLRWYPGKWRRVLRVEDTDDEGNVTYSAERLETGSTNKWRTSINYPLVRYSDVLLMKAEAINQLYGPTLDAVDNINEVRERAGASTVQDLLSEEGEALTSESLFEIIKDERSRELCFEGVRRFDLVRWGILVESMQNQNDLILNHPDYNSDNDVFLTYPGTYAEEKHSVFPIPNDEITLNSQIEQHPLW